MSTAEDRLLHRRQFVFGPARHDDWPVVHVAGGLVSCHPELRVVQVDGAHGSWTVLGDPVATSGAAGLPEDQLATCAPDAVRTTTAGWTGRWTVIDPAGRLHLDPSGLLACVFRRHDGRLWASSSPALLAALPGLPPLADDGRRLAHQVGANWHAAPGTGFVGLDRLLPSQELDLPTGRVLARRLAPDLPRRTAEEVAGELQQRVTTALRHLVEHAPRVWIGLTAGIDSRTVLACAVAADLPVSTYTQLHDRMSLADRELPARLAAAAGVPHVMVRPGPPDPARLALYDAHSALAAQDRDRDFFARGQWDFLGAGEVAVRSGAFEVARSSWHRRNPHGHTGHRIPPLEVLRTFLAETSPAFSADLERWRDWAEQHPEPDLLWVDRIYWEQRLGAWAPTTEQSLDLLDGRSFVPANCRALFEALLSLPEADRAAKSAQRLVLAGVPVLDAFPLNPGPRAFPLPVRYAYATRLGLRHAVQRSARSTLRRTRRDAARLVRSARRRLRS